MEIQKSIKHYITVIILGLGIVMGVSYVQAAWTSAPANPPNCPDTIDGCNTPLNVGNNIQLKRGQLSINTDTVSPFAVGLTVFGKVGIGRSTPTAKLEVLGGSEVNPITINSLGVATDANRALNFNVDNSNYGKITIPAGSGGAMSFWTGGANLTKEQVRITKDGNVGIGTQAPGAKLEVVGTVKITGGTPGAGKVLTSTDTAGNATWQTASGGQTIRFDKWVEIKATGGAGYVKCNDGWIVTQAGHYTSSGDNENTIVRCTRVDPTYSNPAFSFMASGGAYSAYTITATSPNPYTP